MKKATSWTGENSDRICWCIPIAKRIIKKTHSRFLGLLSDKENVPNASSVASADEGVVDNNDVSEMRLVVNTLLELDNLYNGGEPPLPPPELPPLDIPCHCTQQNATGNNKGGRRHRAP
jgi:hypothetical protein